MLSTEGGRTGMGRRIWLSFRALITGNGGAIGLRSVSGVLAALELVLMTVDGTGVWSGRGEPCGKRATRSSHSEQTIIVIWRTPIQRP